MTWEEFKTLLAGLNHKTPLGRVITIRSETDKEVIKEFTPEMRKIRNEWLSRNAKAKSAETTADFIEQMKQAFIAMAGGAKSEKD